MPTIARLLSESLPDSASWQRIADPAWADPVDPSFAATIGGRWNPPGSWPTLYLNEDIVTARLNMALFTDPFPYEPEDLRPDHAPVLVEVRLPRSQIVADVHTPGGIAKAGLPATYPVYPTSPTGHGEAKVGHGTCQDVGQRAHALGLRGVRCRSATSPLGEGRELAWFPATARSRATIVDTTPFVDWYWA